MSSISDLYYMLSGVTLLFFAASSFALIHLYDNVGKLKEQLKDLKTSAEIARDRVSYLYDQVSRVETKVDVKETLEDLHEAIQDFAQTTEAKD